MHRYRANGPGPEIDAPRTLTMTIGDAALLCFALFSTHTRLEKESSARYRSLSRSLSFSRFAAYEGSRETGRARYTLAVRP